MLQTEIAKGSVTAVAPANAGELVSTRAEFTFTAGQLTLNQIVEMAPLPAGCDLVDAILDSDDLDDDGTPAITLDVGIMSGDAGVDANDRTCGDEIFDGSTVAQAGGVVRPTAAKAFRIARSNVDRGIGLKVATAPDSAVAGKVGLTIIYRG